MRRRRHRRGVSAAPAPNLREIEDLADSIVRLADLIKQQVAVRRAVDDASRGETGD